jgi:WD40 repeat protein
VATARELAAAANANLEVDPERSILLALAAVDRTRSGDGAALPESEEALHSAVNASRIELTVPGVGGHLDWSPDGTRFVAEGPEGSGTVDIRDARTGDLLRSIPGHDGDLNDLAFNHDGTLLATTGTDGAARIWDVATGDELHTVEVPDYLEAFGVWGPSFSADGALFAAAWPAAGVVKILDLGTGRVVQEIRSVAAPFGTSFDPSGARIAVSQVLDPEAVVADVGSGDRLFTLKGHLAGVLDIAWSQDGVSIATASGDGTARIFDGRTGAHRLALLNHSGPVLGLDWSPDGSRVVTASGDGTTRLWQVTEGGARLMISLTAQVMRKGVNGVSFSPDGTRVMTGDLAGTATTVWDVSMTGDAEVANLPAVAAAFGAVAFTSDGRRLVATGAGGSVTVWDAHTFTRVRTLGVSPGSPPPPTLGGSSHSPPATSLGDAFSIAVSRDGRLVAAARYDGTVRVWDVETGVDAFTVHAGPTFRRQPWMDVAWNRAGELLAIATNDGLTGRVTIVDRAGREVAVLQEDYGIAVGSVAFSPDGEQLITTRLPTVESDPDDGQVVIWDWKAAEVERTIDTPARHARLSPAGDLIASDTRTQAALWGDTVHVWDAASGRRVSTLSGHSGGVWDFAFSPDGSRLATTGFDGTIWIWDPRSGEPLQVLRGHRGAVTAVAFSPDGSRLASVGAEGTVRVWALELDDLVEIAEKELKRTLTDEECQQYLHLRRCP